ncbi:Dixin [Lamellibrachia satsuma]|nr:Dixin [Lamellibrachia satsuma]
MDMNTAQIKAYIAWVNAQLKKRSDGTQQVTDLKVDMHDGVALVDLIDIVAGKHLEGINRDPSSADEMLANVEQVIHFMTLSKIKMHHTAARDIVEGNMKSIMRLILALAAHFKPNSVRQTAQYDKVTSHVHLQSVAGIAQGAAAALADARRDAASIVHHPRRPRQLAGCHRDFGHRSSGTGSDSDHSHPGVQRCLDFGAAECSDPKSDAELSVRSSEAGDSGELEQLRAEHTGLKEELDLVNRSLHRLQQLLLSGQPVSGEEACCSGSGEPVLPAEGSTADEEVVILRSKLQQSEAVCHELRRELSQVKNECLQLHGTKEGLQQRLSEEHHSFLVMKAELLKAGFSQQNLETLKADLEQRMEEKERLIMNLRRELARQHREMEEVKVQCHMSEKEKETAKVSLRSQIEDLQRRLRQVTETEASLSSRVTSQDRKMARLQDKILQSQPDRSSTRPSSAPSTHSTGSDDLQLVRESLRCLRTSLPSGEPQLQAIDVLEQSISSLVERLHVTEQSSHTSDEARDGGCRRFNYDSTGDARRSPITPRQDFSLQRLDQSETNGNISTKVLYFTDRTVTPFMCTIPKRLGEIRLRDICSLFDKHGSYRYHFKTLDPEFGTVKEEITHEDDIVPGWEGKIVAWIEEDHG